MMKQCCDLYTAVTVTKMMYTYSRYALQHTEFAHCRIITKIKTSIIILRLTVTIACERLKIMKLHNVIAIQQ